MIGEKELAIRRGYIGSSDAPAVCGVESYGKTAGDVWARITGRLAADGQSTNAMESGRRLETPVLDWLEERIGVPIERNVTIGPVDGMAIANLDAWIPPAIADRPVIVEAKTTSNVEPWGEDGSDEVPDYVMIQTHHQASCVQRAHRVQVSEILVPVLVARYGFEWRLYRYPVDPDLIAEIEEEESKFWTRYVIADVAPTDVPSLDTLRRMRRVPEIVADVAVDVLDRYLTAKDTAKRAEEAKDEAQRELIAALGEAELGRAGLWSIAYRERSRKEHVVPAGTYRALDVRKKKER